MFHRNTQRLETSLPWWQASAPPPLGLALVTYVLMVIPAIAGVIWRWPWLFTLGLVVPGLLAHEILGYKSAQARDIHLREEVPASARMTILAVVATFVGVSVATSGPKYATPLRDGYRPPRCCGACLATWVATPCAKTAESHPAMSPYRGEWIEMNERCLCLLQYELLKLRYRRCRSIRASQQASWPAIAASVHVIKA